MVWIVIAVGVGVLLAVALGLLLIRRPWDDPDAEDVDPLFTTGIALTGAGVALGTTIGPVMYLIMAVGLIVMAIGARRTGHHRNG